MSARFFISHSTPDTELGSGIAQFLEATIEGARVQRSSLPGRMPDGGEDSLAALKQQIASADAVVGLLTARALTSGEVPFQLGAAWALGKRLVLLRAHGDSAGELYLPMGHAETLALGPEALLELAASLADLAGLRADPGARARAALAALFPDCAGLDRPSGDRSPAVTRSSGSTQQIWPVGGARADAGGPSRRAQRPGLPSCTASFEAGRALADCVFHRASGGRFADELDVPFGAFLNALGTSWTTLRELDDLDVWVEAAENVLGALEPAERHVRCFYEVGYQLSTLINLAHASLEGEPADAPALRQASQAAWQALREAALQARVAAAELEALHPLVQNLCAPLEERDFANLGRVQEGIRELAARADAETFAASA